MILRTLKSNRSVNYFLFPLLGLLFWLKSLLKPQIYPFFSGETEAPLYVPINNLVNHSAFLQSVLALFMLILLAFMVQQVNNRYDFIRTRTILPAPLFVIIISGFADMHTIHPVYFAAVFVLMAIYRLFMAFDINKPYSIAFDTGFILGIGTLFYFNLFALLPAFLIGIGILARDYRWREFVILFIGFLLPLIFALGFAFYNEQLLELLKTIELNFTTQNTYFKINIPLQILLGYLVLLTLAGSLKIIQQYDSKKVSTRKFFTIFFLIFLFSLAGFVLIPAISQEMVVLSAIPLTFLISNFFVFLKSRFWGELIFSVLLCIVIIIQIFA